MIIAGKSPPKKNEMNITEIATIIMLDSIQFDNNDDDDDDGIIINT